MKVISGGQVGADVAGLRAAKRLGLKTGGWMPKGYRTRSGPRPEYARLYGVREAPSSGYPERTRMNVADSDATVRFAFDFNSAGERLTKRELFRHRSPFIDVPARLAPLPDSEPPQVVFDRDPTDLAVWLQEVQPETLNVAGNANHLLERPVEEFLVEALAWWAPPVVLPGH